MANAVHLIHKKRNGGALSEADIHALVAGYTAGEIADYQMSAFLMAAYLNGLNATETAALTQAMLHSGAVLDIADLPKVKVDKHSSGGVGDKVSLILAPVVAACGVPVPMISGRGLGHSGGTADKMESIPGFRNDLALSDYCQQLKDIGIVMISQTLEIAPADRKLYALRDVTGLVDFVPFIASSIMSKKLAEGIDALVLDIKCGRGAFMQTEPDARRLAETLVSIGEEFGKPTVAWMTRMDEPLGRAVGNWPEVIESIECLQGANVPDLMEVTLMLAGEMICLGGAAATPEAGINEARTAIASGRAFEMFCRMVEHQNGDVEALLDPWSRAGIPEAIPVHAPVSSYVASIDARAIGWLSVDLGAGRRLKKDIIDPTAGLFLHKKAGEHVEAGEIIANLYTQRTTGAEQLVQQCLDAYTFSDISPHLPDSLLMARYTQEGWS